MFRLVPPHDTVQVFGIRLLGVNAETGNERTVRFLTKDSGVRDVKDAMSRDILDGFDAAGIEVASATYDIVRVPPLRIETADQPTTAPDGKELHS